MRTLTQLLRGGSPVDRQARDHAAGIVSSLLDKSLAWEAAPGVLGTYSGKDRGVVMIHAELRSVAEEAANGMVGTDAEMDNDLDESLRRAECFLRSGCEYRWHERGPVEIVGAYLGIAALAWMGVAAAGAILGWGHEAVIAGALFALLLMYVMAAAMGVALLRRLWWRISARREGADLRAWPFFTHAEHHAARAAAPGSGAW